MSYVRTQGEQEFYDWLVAQPPPPVKPIVNTDDPLERYIDKEKRLERLIKNRQRAKRRRQMRMDASQLTTKEVGECLARMITGTD